MKLFWDVVEALDIVEEPFIIVGVDAIERVDKFDDTKFELKNNGVTYCEAV